MGSPNGANVLIVDDEVDEGKNADALAADLQKMPDVEAFPRRPSDVGLEELRDANLVLVDYKLKTWPERDRIEGDVCLQPIDGLALAGILNRRAHAEKGASPTGIAIFTGQYRDLAHPLSDVTRPHVLARMLGVEWVFEKGDERVTECVACLAKCISSLPQRWADAAIEAAGKLLEVDERFLEDVADALPPIHDMSEWSHGLAFVRWLLHRILPYPTFLRDELFIALRCRVLPNQMSEALEDDSPLRRKLAEYEYTGVLQGFDGPRWWRRGIELFLWEITKGRPHDYELLQSKLREIAKTPLENASDASDLVLALDGELKPREEFVSLSDAVRIQPDDWPPHAEQPWVLIEDAIDNAKLAALVVREDREELDMQQ